MNNTTNWVEFFNAAGTFTLLIISALTTAWIKIQNRRILDVKSEVETAKGHAEKAVETVEKSREERQEQLTRMEGKADAAYSHANNTNDKMAEMNAIIARQQSEILHLRELQTLQSTPPANPAPPADASGS